jgi:hypothetical protein
VSTLLQKIEKICDAPLNTYFIVTRSRAKCDILFSDILDKIFLLRDFSQKFRLRLDICAQLVMQFPAERKDWVDGMLSTARRLEQDELIDNHSKM